MGPTAARPLRPPPSSGTSDLERSIAVLPFESLGGEQSGQLAEGVHGDLLTRLSNISDLRVISRTSVKRFRETRESLPRIADELDVRWVVVGTVQQADGQVRVNAQLIHAPDDDHRWARTYQRDLTAANLFDIQSELAKEVARSLEAEVSPGERARIERAPTRDLEAYRLYVQGRTHLDRRTPEGLRRGLELLRDAIARDSSYAPAFAGLADARILLVTYGLASGHTLYPSAARAARRALELDPDLAEAHAALGHVLAADGDVPAAIRRMHRAIELNPSYARVHSWLAALAGALGRPDAALRHTRQAVELDPRSPLDQLLRGWTLAWAEGPSEQALRHVRRAGSSSPGSPSPTSMKAWSSPSRAVITRPSRPWGSVRWRSGPWGVLNGTTRSSGTSAPSRCSTRSAATPGTPGSSATSTRSWGSRRTRTRSSTAADGPPARSGPVRPGSDPAGAPGG